ncbi:hypothetical protein [Segatella copri]|uniref:hypothetical protein n=1 Tax=Segatella copri TaxID=165179 RepID=UPI003F8A24C0
MWSKRHAKILSEYFQELEKSNIRFFIIRNYEGLPDKNTSKDVDIILKYGTVKAAERILKDVFKRNGLFYYYRVVIEESYLCRAISEKGDFAIHIDLMNGYINRGVELFTFEELYSQTIDYNGFRVLNELYNGVMLFIYKQFGYKKPILKDSYKDTIYNCWLHYPEFSSILEKMLGKNTYSKVSECIKQKDFDGMLAYSPMVSKQLRKYSNCSSFIINQYRRMRFVIQKVNRIVFQYRKYEKSFSVMAPDGTGKTTFLTQLLNRLAFLYVDAPNNTGRFHLYHFRPSLFPNLGEVGEKARIMKQDTDFTNPHRAKPAGLVSSLIRITYYWMDYVLGWMYYTRRDVQYDLYTVYDRYSYDLLVDPRRTRLKLPYWVRRCFVACMPHPKINFFLKASPDVIIKRKAELTHDEIIRQVSAYERLSVRKNVITIDANRCMDEMIDEALPHLLSAYWEKL